MRSPLSRSHRSPNSPHSGRTPDHDPRSAVRTSATCGIPSSLGRPEVGRPSRQMLVGLRRRGSDRWPMSKATSVAASRITNLLRKDPSSLPVPHVGDSVVFK
jgi:hypothetical protein